MPPTLTSTLLLNAVRVSVPDVICVYIDMKDSTKLAAGAGNKKVARAFQLYTSTAVRLLNAFDAPYIDVRGDGAFALFDRGQHYRALAAAITFKTFAYRVAVPAIEATCGVRVGSHIGVDQKGVLVRRIGYRRTQERDDRQNEVWAGQPVNMAAKLASMSGDDELLVSDRFYDRITDDHARRSCSCDGRPQPLWVQVDLSAPADSTSARSTGWTVAYAHCMERKWRSAC
jgi:class 3 adenylate cyclase